MDTNIAPASLASGRAVPIRAECGCGVHDAPRGCAWNHCHEEYVWTPVCFTTAPHHGLVWSYPLSCCDGLGNPVLSSPRLTGWRPIRRFFRPQCVPGEFLDQLRTVEHLLPEWKVVHHSN